MKIKEIIKKFFRKDEEPKLLLEENNEKKTNKFKDDLFVGSVNVAEQHTLEECIEEFFKQYSLQDKYNPNGSKKAYKAYSRLFCEEEKIGDNLKNQKRLEKLVKKNACNVNYQISNNRLVFMHISGQEGIDEYKDLDMQKIYINCKREDISILTAAIFKQIKGIAGDKLQMKCISEQKVSGYGDDEEYKELKNYQRNDRIVIYAENREKAAKMCDAISLLKRNNPKIFKGIKKIPILPNQDGFMVVTSKKDNQYVQTPIGTASGVTYNDYVSDVLYNSAILACDKEFGIDSNDDYSLRERMSEYARIFPEIEDEQKKRIILNCKKIFKELCKEGNIELAEAESLTNKNEQVK